MKDFDYFIDRTNGGGLPVKFGTSPTDQQRNKALLSLQGEEWRLVRATFTPIFTSGKMKNMMTFINLTSEEVSKALEKCADTKEEVNPKNLCGSFSMETISSCVFGVKAGSFNTSGGFKVCQLCPSDIHVRAP